MHCSSFSVFFFFKQKTAYEMRISDWSSDVCSSDLRREIRLLDRLKGHGGGPGASGKDFVELLQTAYSAAPPFLVYEYIDGGNLAGWLEIGRASCRERVCQYV